MHAVQRIDALSLACALLVFLYVVLRGFQLENVEFGVLVVLMFGVLGLVILAHVQKKATTTNTEVTRRPPSTTGGKRRRSACYVCRPPNTTNTNTETTTERVGKKEIAVGVTASWKDVWRALLRLVRVLFRKHVYEPVSEVAAVLFWKGDEDDQKGNNRREGFMTGYFHKMIDTPRQVGAIIEPKIDDISRGFRRFSEDEPDVEYVFVGDGRDKDEVSMLDDPMTIEEYNAVAPEKFPHLLKSDEQYEKDKQEIIRRRKEELRKKNAARARFREEMKARQKKVPGMVGYLARKKEEREQKEETGKEKQKEGEKKKKKEDFVSYLQRKKEEMEEEEKKGLSDGTSSPTKERNIGWTSKKKSPQDTEWNRDVDLSPETEEDVERTVQKEEEKGTLTDDKGFPLRFDVDAFKEMIREYQKIDYALCMLRTHDRDMFTKLMKLDWFRRYLRGA